MGYRSDVLIAVAFKDKEQRDEVWAVYVMDPRVQKHDLTGVWKNYDEGDYPVLWYEADYVKWYDYYGDVQGIEHLIEVASNFARERGQPFAAINYRVGEELSDIDTTEREADPSGEMLSFLFDMCGIRRELTHNFN
jgi:hypothetical protein